MSSNEITDSQCSVEILQRIVEVAPTGMCLVDPAGQIVLVNAQAETMFGYRRSELLGRPVEMLVPDRFRVQHVIVRDDFFANPQVRSMGNGRSLCGRRKDGSEFPVEIGLVPFPADSGLFVLATVLDVTERKRAEDRIQEASADLARRGEELKAQRRAALNLAADAEEARRTAEGNRLALAKVNQEMKQEIAERRRVEEQLHSMAAELTRSNQELELFASVASHDLQEPLRMVASYLELLAKRYQGRLDDKADRWINFAVDAATRMKQLINDLLEFSRVGTRGKPLVPTDSQAVFANALLNLEQAIQESGAVIRHGNLPTILGDAPQLTRVLQNLIGNALKFRAKDKTPEIHVDATANGAHWLFSVKDNGIGIDQQFAKRIFVIFQRLHTREEFSGTGIGLAVCKKIVERHGGRMWVESQLGSGATFFFTLSACGDPQIDNDTQ